MNWDALRAIGYDHAPDCACDQGEPALWQTYALLWGSLFVAVLTVAGKVVGV